MRLWLSRSGEVSLRQQLQVVLGIVCGELQPGERLVAAGGILLLADA